MMRLFAVSDLVTVTFRAPRLVRDRMISLAANNPDQYYSTSEAWIKAGLEFLQQHEPYIPE